MYSTERVDSNVIAIVEWLRKSELAEVTALYTEYLAGNKMKKENN